MSISASKSENGITNINSNESFAAQDDTDTSQLLSNSNMRKSDTEINIGMDPKKTGFRSIEILARLVMHVVSNFWKLCTTGVLILLLVLWFYGGLVTFVLFCGGILGLLYHSQDMFLYYPNQPPNSRLFVPSPSSLGLPYESHFVRTGDGIHVNMVLMKQAAPMCGNCPTVIYFHGNAGNIGHRLQDAHGLFTLCGFNVLFVEYRGYGKSEGSPSEGGLYKDAEAAMDFVLRRKDLDQSKLVLTGRSLGGAIAVYLASHSYYARFIFTLILENSFTSLPAIAKELLRLNCIQKLPKWCYKNKYPTLERLRRVSTPVLFISGLQDELVPPNMMIELYQACSSSKKLLGKFESGSHNDTWTCPGYYHLVSNFIAQVYALKQSSPHDASSNSDTCSSVETYNSMGIKTV